MPHIVLYMECQITFSCSIGLSLKLITGNWLSWGELEDKVRLSEWNIFPSFVKGKWLENIYSKTHTNDQLPVARTVHERHRRGQLLLTPK